MWMNIDRKFKKQLSVVALLVLPMTAFANSSSDKELVDGRLVLEAGWSLYFFQDYANSEALAKSLKGGRADLNGAATLLLANISYQRKQYQATLKLLQEHDALADLYKSNGPGAYKNPHWSNDERTLYYRLKALSGKARYHLGQTDESVRMDLMDGLSYEDKDPMISVPDIEGLQILALMSLSAGRYEEAIGYWGRVVVGGEKLAKSRDLSDKEKEFFHATEYNIACAYSKLGKVERVLEWLGKSVSYKPEERLEFILADRDLDNVRDDPRFLEFISGMKNQIKGATH
jgi:tetratricopeptide (TPR) repeat protein